MARKRRLDTDDIIEPFEGSDSDNNNITIKVEDDNSDIKHNDKRIKIEHSNDNDKTVIDIDNIIHTKRNRNSRSVKQEHNDIDDITIKQELDDDHVDNKQPQQARKRGRQFATTKSSDNESTAGYDDRPKRNINNKQNNKADILVDKTSKDNDVLLPLADTQTTTTTASKSPYTDYESYVTIYIQFNKHKQKQQQSKKPTDNTVIDDNHQHGMQQIDDSTNDDSIDAQQQDNSDNEQQSQEDIDDNDDDIIPTVLQSTTDNMSSITIVPTPYAHNTTPHIPIQPVPIYMSPFNCGKGIRLDSNNITVYGDKGYRSIRSTHGISSGCMYFEIYVKQRPDNNIPTYNLNKDKPIIPLPHVRVGWSTDKHLIDTPIGYDRHSYSYSSSNGYKYHEAYGHQYGLTYNTGDIIGCYISLPTLHEFLYKHKNFDYNTYLIEQQRRLNPELYEQQQTLSELQQQRKKNKKGKAKKQVIVDDTNDNELVSKPTLTPVEVEMYKQRSETYVLGSEIKYYLNGQLQGTAFTDLLREIYIPSVSLYMGATVECNFGPHYWCVPDELLNTDITHSGLSIYNNGCNAHIKRNPQISSDKIGIQTNEPNIIHDKPTKQQQNKVANSRRNKR